MTRILTALFVLFLSLSAQAGTITIVSQSCNVANTSCALVGDGGQQISINPQSAAMTIDGKAYTGAITSSVLIERTNYRVTSELTYTFTPTATADAMHILARSGSGRGGYQWHAHYLFTSVTVY